MGGVNLGLKLRGEFLYNSAPPGLSSLLITTGTGGMGPNIPGGARCGIAPERGVCERTLLVWGVDGAVRRGFVGGGGRVDEK
jgi:hypothetical protein